MRAACGEILQVSTLPTFAQSLLPEAVARLHGEAGGLCDDAEKRVDLSGAALAGGVRPQSDHGAPLISRRRALRIGKGMGSRSAGE